jgi:hypothetical protein
MPEALSMVTPSSATTLAFVALVLALAALLIAGVVHAGRTLGEAPAVRARRAVVTAIGLALWLGATALVPASGVLARAMLPPPVMLFFLASIGVAIAAALSPLGTSLVRGIPVAALIATQAFRLPLELILHAWKDQGVLPLQMTFEGRNFDIVTGVLAVIIAVWSWRAAVPRAALWAFNVIGSALLLNVMSIAVLSSPVPFRQFMNEPPVLLAFYAPYSWIVPICVGGALFAHILIFRSLLARDLPARSKAVSRRAALAQ